jgi:hypothetical protein
MQHLGNLAVVISDAKINISINGRNYGKNNFLVINCKFIVQ